METASMRNEQAEIAVLGALMTNEVLIYEADLCEKDFTTDKRRILWKRMNELAEQGVIVDAVTLAEYLNEKDQLQRIGGASYLAELLNSTPFKNHESLRHYQDILKEKTNKRELYRLLESYKKEIEKQDSRFLAEELMDKIVKLQETNSQEYAQLLETAEKSFVNRLEEMTTEGMSNDRLSTGIEKLDKFLNGVSESDFTIISAEPGAGKTTLALEIADNITYDGGSVLWLTAEMLKEEIYQKMVAKNTGTSINHMEQGLLDERQVEIIREFIKDVRQRRFFIAEISGLNVFNVLTEIRRFQRTENIDAVVIDYLQLLKNHSSGNRFENLREVSAKLNEFTKREKVPVIGIVSLNQNGNVYGVSQAAYDCNNHITMVKKFEENCDGIEADLGDRYVVVKKARRGPGGVTQARLLGESSQLFWEDF